MSLAETHYQVEYPETDGQPIGETELHVHWTMRLRDILKYRGLRVYVGADMFIYYVEGQPYKNVVPDVFVVLDCDSHMRNVFKTWEEGKVPNVVLEITSKGTREEDQAYKPDKYARLGVEEYFLYDPRGEYLHPALQAFRLTKDGYEPVQPNGHGQFECPSLEITLELDGQDLLLRDARTGVILPTEAEAAEARRKLAEAEREAAEAQRDAAEAQREAAEAQRDATEAQREAAEARRAAAEAERDAARAERDAAQTERDAALHRNAALEAELQRLREQQKKGGPLS